MFVGVDGFKRGWVAIAIAMAGSGFREARCSQTFDELATHYADARVIAVDMPIALVEEGDRDADQAARDFLTGQASSVFNAPPRAVLAAKSYEEAQKISRRFHGKGISKQSFAIVRKIIEVREFIGDERIHEVHPEVSFRLLSGGRRLGKKKTWGGLRARLRLLKSAGIELPEDLGDVNEVGIDDVVDAAAAAWSARRIAVGEARRFPAEGEQRDGSGRAVAIWA